MNYLLQSSLFFANFLEPRRGEVHGVSQKSASGRSGRPGGAWERTPPSRSIMRQNDERIWGNLGRCRAFGVRRRVFTENNPMDETQKEGPGPDSVERAPASREEPVATSTRENR